MQDLMTEIRSIEQLATNEDIEQIAMYMDQLRRTGIAPSDTVKKGLDFTELFVKDMYPNRKQLTLMRLTAYLLEKAAISVGIHAEQKRQQELETKRRKAESASTATVKPGVAK